MKFSCFDRRASEVDSDRVVHRKRFYWNLIRTSRWFVFYKLNTIYSFEHLHTAKERSVISHWWPIHCHIVAHDSTPQSVHFLRSPANSCDPNMPALTLTNMNGLWTCLFAISVLSLIESLFTVSVQSHCAPFVFIFIATRKSGLLSDSFYVGKSLWILSPNFISLNWLLKF